MFKRFKLLTVAALMAFAVAACDEGGGTLTPSGTGTIQGRVTVDGAGKPGVVVTLGTGGATATTDATGTYKFENVNVGPVTVSIPAQTGVTFANGTSQVANLTTDARS
jgi:hypothetical protein